jgi:hypothetical protein
VQTSPHSRIEIRIAAHFAQLLEIVANACGMGICACLQRVAKGCVGALSAAPHQALAGIRAAPANWCANARKSAINSASGIFETPELAAAMAV